MGKTIEVNEGDLALVVRKIAPRYHVIMVYTAEGAIGLISALSVSCSTEKPNPEVSIGFSHGPEFIAAMTPATVGLVKEARASLSKLDFVKVTGLEWLNEEKTDG